MQPTPPGWYWDPGNRPGLYRWWDGRSWHETLSADPRAAAPAPLDLPTPDAAGRLTGGGLAVPLLAEPWAPCPPYPEGIEQVAGQSTEVGRTPRGPYLAAVFVGMLAADRATVDAVHALALRHGGSCEGPPGLRPEYHANYYGAYFRDPDGNKLCVCCHEPA